VIARYGFPIRPGDNPAGGPRRPRIAAPIPLFVDPQRPLTSKPALSRIQGMINAPEDRTLPRTQ